MVIHYNFFFPLFEGGTVFRYKGDLHRIGRDFLTEEADIFLSNQQNAMSFLVKPMTFCSA